MQTSGTYVVKNVRIVKPTRIIEGDLCIENGVVTYIGQPLDEPAGRHVVDGRGRYAVPGFIDMHGHGGRLFDLTEGLYDPKSGRFDNSAEAFDTGLPALLASVAQNGTARVVLATLAAPQDKLCHALRCAARYIDSPRNGVDGAYLHGIFIEGSFIKYAEFAGAQNPQYFLAPSVETFQRLDEAAGGHICYVNVVPEHGEQAFPLMAHLRSRGILIGAGHTDASARQYLAAVPQGLRVAVHFTNGPTGSSFKPFGGGGVLQAVLGSRRVIAELIVDGYHVNPAYILDVIRRKGSDRVVGITDSMFLTGDTTVGQFEVAGIKGRRSENGRYLEVVGKRHTLFGSVLTMAVGFANLVSWMTGSVRGIWHGVHEPLDTDEAVLTATHLCAVNPAKALGFFDPPNQQLGQDISMCAGGIQVGKRADVAVIRLDGEPGAYDVLVDHVFVKGKLAK